ncbi:hypothetical protein ABPG77_003387 [Micractinium sp. CCAP 211/92]
MSGGKQAGATQAFYLQAMAEDPRVAVVMAFALPSLSLSFGYTPSRADMEAAGQAVEPHLAALRPWEVAVLVWGAARLGFSPGPSLLGQLQRRVAAILQAEPGAPGAFTPQEACMAAWALSVLQAQTPELWAAEMGFVAACPPDSLDEVALIHLWQAAMFTNRPAVTQAVPPAGGTSGSGSTDAVVPRMRSAADEVRATLAAGSCPLPLPLIDRCEQAYRAASRQAGFDGPYLVELTMLQLLVTIHQELGASVAYQPFFTDLKLLDLQHVRQLLADPYLLAKFKGDIADKRARSNRFVRALEDVSRTLRGMGLHHVVQAPVEDGLVHVDVALPDYKIAFFLQPHAGQAPGGSPSSSSSGSRLSTLDAEGTMLSGYVANETPGTQQAKLRMLAERGWVVLQLSWPVDSIRGEAEKRRLLLEQLDRAGQQQLMRGRVSSMLHGAMRQAEESKLGGGRYGDRGSAGQYITRGGGGGAQR